MIFRLLSVKVNVSMLTQSLRLFLITIYTWDLVSLPTGKKVIGCCWVFAVRFNPDESIARLKARLVAKGYAQTHRVDYSNTFSPVAKLTSVCLFISLANSYDWDLHHIKNVFLHGDLQGLHGATSGVCCSGEDRKGVSSSEIFVWFETKSPCLVWKI